jgi:multiple sugar transport system ATP-binding protein
MSETETEGVEPEGAETEAVDAETEVVDVDPRAAGVRLSNVSKSYRGGVEAIRDVTLHVEPGEFVVLVGPSGCG